jgi:hypothetical protein
MTIAGVLVDVGRATASFGMDLISIEFDAVTEETHNWTNTVTSSPVEDGSNITDNILQDPRKITLTGVITNAPIFNTNTSTTPGVPSTNERTISSVDDAPQETIVNRVFGLLSDLMVKGELVSVFTRYIVYTDMAITSINIPRTVGIGEAIVFTIDFQEVRIVSTQNVAVPAGISAKLDKKTGASVQKKTMPPKTDGPVATPDLNKSQLKTGVQFAQKVGNFIIDTAKGLAQ